MVAGLLHQLGVNMGARVDPSNQEDIDFLTHRGIRRIFWNRAENAKRKEYIKHARSLISARNASYETWGWKDPISSYYISDIHRLLINPHYIFVVRDAAAVASREMKHSGDVVAGDSINLMGRALKEYSDCLSFVSGVGSPALVISYERALRHSLDTVKLVSEFAGISSLEPGRREELAQYIQPERNTAAFG
ncbi:hypothetical protein HT102_11850 [Hoyosella sp. G463]|uniref:Sulfotransferase family protein n=2 Tax=Lolliginicoccus lacisalsi TaxID=2742202 RepID=A0A927JDE1_9ACTN|nr:hypothetical protein [Lolliginicoccus lacisalsi]MBD8507179.1 hypothetical protein [Lolliginicoccus lacisalsi]